MRARWRASVCGSNRRRATRSQAPRRRLSTLASNPVRFSPRRVPPHCSLRCAPRSLRCPVPSVVMSAPPKFNRTASTFVTQDAGEDIEKHCQSRTQHSREREHACSVRGSRRIESEQRNAQRCACSDHRMRCPLVAPGCARRVAHRAASGSASPPFLLCACLQTTSASSSDSLDSSVRKHTALLQRGTAEEGQTVRERRERERRARSRCAARSPQSSRFAVACRTCCARHTQGL